MNEPTDEEIIAFAEELAKLAETQRLNAVEQYQPYPKQQHFHKLGATVKERLLSAGTQCGKSYCGAAEMAYHLTGLYPDWWEGKKFDRPIVAIVGSKTAALTRDGVQKYLMGPPEAEELWGTGSIPKHLIISRSRQAGTANALDSVAIRHVSGGISRLLFKSYDQGRQKWQANSADVVWFDEEPDMEVYLEGCARTVATGGIIYMTFTPLMGRSEVVLRYLNEATDQRVTIKMSMSEVGHFQGPEGEKRKAAALSIYAEHEREAREHGEPTLGAGGIFQLNQREVICDPVALMGHWAVIGGLDIGMDHPTAAVWVAWDRDVDVVYIYHEYRAVEYKIAMHASAMRARGPMIPWAWPHDGNIKDKGSGEPIVALFKKEGLNMLHSWATWPTGGYSTEAAIMEIQNREASGRLKYFSNCVNILAERRTYHRDTNGHIVKKEDDLLSALMKALMMLRFARPYEKVMAINAGRKKNAMASGLMMNGITY